MQEKRTGGSYLGLDQDQVNEEDHKVMLDIFIRKPLTLRTLCQAHTLAQRLVISFAVCCIQVAHGKPAFDTYRHLFVDVAIIHARVCLCCCTRRQGVHAPSLRTGFYVGLRLRLPSQSYLTLRSNNIIQLRTKVEFTELRARQAVITIVRKGNSRSGGRALKSTGTAAINYV